MDIKDLPQVTSLVDDIQDFINNPNFSPKDQNKWFFSDGLSYYQQLCEIMKLLQYFQQAFKIVQENEYVIASNYEELTSLPAKIEFIQKEIDNLNIIKYASPINWNSENIYEVNTVVVDNNVAYLSRKEVPKGVAITDSEYWLMIYQLEIALPTYHVQSELLELQGIVDYDTIIETCDIHEYNSSEETMYIKTKE